MLVIAKSGAVLTLLPNIKSAHLFGIRTNVCYVNMLVGAAESVNCAAQHPLAAIVAAAVPQATAVVQWCRLYALRHCLVRQPQDRNRNFSAANAVVPRASAVIFAAPLFSFNARLRTQK
jgi:hypothetical protein